MSKVTKGSLWKYKTGSFTYIKFIIIYYDVNVVGFKTINEDLNQKIQECDIDSWYERFEPIN